MLDTDGDELRSGVQYYIVSLIWGAGGRGLELASIISGDRIPCPKYVAQNRFTNGLPVLFHPVDSSDTTVYLSTDVNIGFPGIDAYCRSSNTWRVAPFNSSTGRWWIVNGGEIGNPGPETLFNWFKIEKLGLGYKLTFCPSVCDWCVTLCNDISRYTYQNNVLLGLTKENGWPFVFVKASGAIKQVVEKHSE